MVCGVTGLGSPLVVLIFLAAAAATWVAGISLSKTTDALDARFELGDELGGLILLAVAGSLPELAITISAAASGNLSLAAGNLIGGIAIQTMVLLVCDFVVGPSRPLTYLVGRLTPVLEALLVILVVAGVEMGSLLKPSTAIFGRVSPASLGIVVVWVVGLYGINRAAKDPRWSVSMPGSQPGRRRAEKRQAQESHPYSGSSTARVATIFGVACAVTLVAGVMLEESGNELQVCLFLVADLIAGRPVLPSAGNQNAWLAALGVALTAVYGFGVISRPMHTRFRLGPDSLLALALFGLGIAGLFYVRPG